MPAPLRSVRRFVALLVVCLAAAARSGRAEPPLGADPGPATDPQASALAAIAREHRLQGVIFAPGPSDPVRLQWSATGSFHQTREFLGALVEQEPGRCSERLVMHAQRDRARHELALTGTMGETSGGGACVRWERLGAALAALSRSLPRGAWATAFSQDGEALLIEGVLRRPEDAGELRQVLQQEKALELVQFSVVGTSTLDGELRPIFRAEGKLPAED
jgi:hypothetical protein